MEAMPLLWAIATNYLCLKYNKPHKWVTYKNGAPAPYAHPPNFTLSECSSDRDPVVDVAQGRHYLK